MNIISRSFSILFLGFFFLLARSDSRSEYFLPLNPRSVFAADLDQDGDNDLVVGHYYSCGDTTPTLSILKNISYGTFEISDTSKVFCGSQENIFAIDVNNDGFPDIVALHYDVTSGNTTNYVRVYYNDNGDISTYADFNLNTQHGATWINYGDFNGDGYLDIVITDNWNFPWGVLYNDGTGYFGSPIYHSSPSSFGIYYILCADMNNDGHCDLIIWGDDIIIYYYYASGWEEKHFDVSGYPGNVGIADFDQDGYNDIVTEDQYYGGMSHIDIFKNLGNKTFQQIPSFQFHGSGRICPADMNNDETPDLVFGNTFGYFMWYNQGNMQFADSQFVAVPYMGETRGFCIADLDNNGFNDIATVRSGIPRIYPTLDLRFNDGNGNFFPDPIVSVGNFSTLRKDMMTCNPNPFNEKTTICFYLQKSNQVELSVYDMRGKLIACLTNQKYKQGTYQVIWAGTDQSGHVCDPGMYLACLKIDGTVRKTLKIILCL